MESPQTASGKGQKSPANMAPSGRGDNHRQPEKKTALQRLTLWTVSLANRPAAEYWLYFVTFLESSIFPIPSDALYVPMVMIKPEKAWRYAFWVSFFSIVGGMAGWAIGHFAYDILAAPLLRFYGKFEQFEALRGSASVDFVLLLLISSGFFHLPPIKIVTILSGAAGVPLWLFIISAIIARAGRYYLLAWLIRRYDTVLIEFLQKHLKAISLVGAALCILVFVLYMCIAYG